MFVEINKLNDMNDLSEPKEKVPFFEMKELNHLYDSTIGLHEKKNQRLNMILEELKSKSNEDQNSLEYLDMYFSNIVDLLFSFNSFLINSVPIMRRLVLENTLKELERFKPFNVDSNNNNSLEKLAISYEKLIKNKKLPIEKLLAKRIRIYEVLFRHSSAHGNLGNLINFLIFNDSNGIYVSLNEDSNNASRLRILIDKKYYSIFSEHPETKDVIKKMQDNQKKYEEEHKIKLAPDAFIYELKQVEQNNPISNDKEYIHYMYLTEEASRVFLKWRGHLLFTRPDFSALFHNNFLLKYGYDVKNIPFGVQSKPSDELAKNSFYMDYDSIKKDIDTFVKLVLEQTEINIIEKRIIYIFSTHKSLMCYQLITKLKFYGIYISEDKLKQVVLDNLPSLKYQEVEGEFEGKILKATQYTIMPL